MITCRAGIKILNQVRFISTNGQKFRYGGKLIRFHPPRRLEPLQVSAEIPSGKTQNTETELLKQKAEGSKSFVWWFLGKARFRLLRYLAVSGRTVDEMSADRGATLLDMSLCDLSPPTCVRGMRILDRDLFTKDVHVPGLTVPVHHISDLSKHLKDLFLKKPGIKPLVPLSETDPRADTHKLFLFDPEKFSGIESLSDAQRQSLSDCDIDKDSVKLYDLRLCYTNWTYHEILRAVLPNDTDGVAGFSLIGHILHLNLREEVLEHKNLIGEVLLDKVPSTRTVVNKLSTIDNKYRNFAMEVLAGEDEMVTVTRENGREYHLDFSKVYWNPRLGTEHKRVVDCLRRDDVLYDVFAGIGPFSVPAAKKGCTVIANDLNPESYRWLQHNLDVNKVRGSYTTHNMDGRDFIKTVVKQDLLRRWASDSKPTERHHIAMNLPALAIEFLDVFRGLFAECGDLESVRLPRVYCYGFSKADSPQSDIRERVESRLGAPLDDGEDEAEMRFVRNVAPGKDMICAVFTPPRQVLFESQTTEGAETDRPIKRQKTDDTIQEETL